jgi:hypothetical protein
MMSQHLRQRLYSSFRASYPCSRTVLLLALLVSVAFTDGTRTLRGSVTDQRGRLLAGAIVQVHDTSTFWIRSYITQGDGLYHFEELSTGDSYQVRAKYKGISSRTKVVGKFSFRTMATVNLVVDLSYSKP